MSKSSSGGNDGSRSSSVECDDANNQQPINIQALVNSNGRIDETPGSADENALCSRNEPLVPNSPPPSYEHVLEETRMAVGQPANNAEDEIRPAANNREREEIPDGGTDRGGRTPIKGPEILHKSSKELYRAVAKQWGITCKMSDQCRCFDCQSHYFDCEYERDEQEKTDGGLGAGTPMFLSEVMHGTACTII
ncbi:uncharacterized protein [Neodiprion pinetum]|uniref:Uncharacterized protein LOC107219774 n=1 Tax=Neodiprion lecontei TaxID=441921 RepID=A0A6J0BGK7_NEOLC|nr:uncharacterized protein LOC107219774 [Neodiprion lecontei]XP_046411401.1 uncharacterized protein LOC124175330 [Neodiprion fabricii]XP_046411402.1 uncharacterized protein LOC124175330 [Neodiprion fabricii]XP_046466995.1 uncharacterized protein LOC124211704 [Neodiprion pinetum]XP_046604713.1 uncharacterized protein LOC124297580 [Neodiprion virginianus]XP_046604714.1 uncharacterized protein LOC124297580 [Neodiprion virginianus]